MDADDPPPSYDDILPMLGVKPRNQRSPNSAAAFRNSESHPLTEEPVPTSRPHTPNPSAPPMDHDSGPGRAQNETSGGSQSEPSFNYSYSTGGGTNFRSTHHGRASPHFTFTSEARSGAGNRTGNADPGAFFSFFTTDGSSPSGSRSNSAGQFFNNFFGEGMSSTGSFGGGQQRQASGIPALDSIVRQLPNSMRFEEGPSHSGDYEFYIRDSMHCLLVKGNVSKTEGVTMTSVNGDTFLHIRNATGKYTVMHRNTAVGTLEVWDGKPDSVKIIRSYENKPYSVKFLGPKDIILSRANRSNENICKIHAAEPASKTCLVFDGSLVFSDPSITTIEACLSIALAVVFMTARNEIQAEAAAVDAGWENCKAMAVCIALVIFIIVMVVVIKNLSETQQERRDRMYGNG